MEFAFLYSIPRSGFLDSFFLIITNLAGSYGQLWVVVGLVLLISRKTRMTGIALLLSYVCVFTLA
jgi:undecaprenyl-diphosphatase